MDQFFNDFIEMIIGEATKDNPAIEVLLYLIMAVICLSMISLVLRLFPHDHTQEERRERIFKLLIFFLVGLILFVFFSLLLPNILNLDNTSQCETLFWGHC